MSLLHDVTVERDRLRELNAKLLAALKAVEWEGWHYEYDVDACPACCGINPKYASSVKGAAPIGHAFNCTLHAAIVAGEGKE